MPAISTTRLSWISPQRLNEAGRFPVQLGQVVLHQAAHLRGEVGVGAQAFLLEERELLVHLAQGILDGFHQLLHGLGTVV
jgi:hypothetical protein